MGHDIQTLANFLFFQSNKKDKNEVGSYYVLNYLDYFYRIPGTSIRAMVMLWALFGIDKVQAMMLTIFLWLAEEQDIDLFRKY